jgi:superoxide dismutase, Fe-Mn family
MNPIPSASDLSRRDAIKILGAGAALASLGVLPNRATAQAPAAAPAAPQPFVLPKLGYAFDALEPHIDARTMEVHYTKHHQAYINNANKALANYPELASLTGEAILADLSVIPEGTGDQAGLRQLVRNNVGGHVNHCFFWQIIAPGSSSPSDAPKLKAAIEARFKSVDALKKEFNAAALTHFGSGWAWLSVDKGGLIVHTTANQGSPLSEASSPIIGLDVWEHAYYLKHLNVRAAYVTDFWSVINWAQAEKNFTTAANA